MYGDGRIFKRGDRYWIEYYVDGKQKREQGGKTESVAKRKLKQRNREKLTGKYLDPKNHKITVDELQMIIFWIWK